MSTALPDSAKHGAALQPAGSRLKTPLVVGILSLIVLVILLEVPTLIAEQKIESKRREIGRAGGNATSSASVPLG